VVVCAAGNNPDGQKLSIIYPAFRHDVIAVGAVNQISMLSATSNMGDSLDVVAPGKDIWSTTINNDYNYGGGTSFAAPIVSGIISLCLSVNPSLTVQEVRDIIEQTARKVHKHTVLYPYRNEPNRPNGIWTQKNGLWFSRCLCSGLYGKIWCNAAVFKVNNQR
jgi:subtilisin family serine protease